MRPSHPRHPCAAERNIFILFFGLGLLISRRRRRKRANEEKKLEESSAEEQKLTELALESEFGKLDDGTTVVDESFFED